MALLSFRYLVLALLPAGSALAQQVPASATLAAATGPAGAAPAGSSAPTVYFTADEMPSFPGGAQALHLFLSRKLQYPPAALDRSLAGKVYVSFVVDPEGRLLDPQVLKGLGHGFDEEALRLVRLMPFWNPGRIKGQPVRVGMTLPIVFRAI